MLALDFFTQDTDILLGVILINNLEKKCYSRFVEGMVFLNENNIILLLLYSYDNYE